MLLKNKLNGLFFLLNINSHYLYQNKLFFFIVKFASYLVNNCGEISHCDMQYEFDNKSQFLKLTHLIYYFKTSTLL